jgi:hypothetical protein
VLDWDDKSIDFEGRGGERGLRGVVCYKGYLYIASNAQILKLDQKFIILDRFSNEYLDNIHEILLYNEDLLITSTGFDSIMWFDLKEEKFKSAFLFRKEPIPTSLIKRFRNKIFPKMRFLIKFYNPNETNHAERKDSTHINSVYTDKGNVYFSGTSLNNLCQLVKGRKVKPFYPIPIKTHKGRFSNGFVFFNNTPTNIVKRINQKINEVFE